MRKKVPEQIQKAEAFLTQDIWDIEEEGRSLPQIALLRLAKILYISVKGLAQKDFLTLASSLTFTTTLSLVPVLALSFAVAKGFGAQEMIQPLIFGMALPGGVAEDVVPKIIEYINRTNVKPLGSIGLVILLFTALNVLGNIEQSFNKIWGVKRRRAFFRRFSDYLSVLTVGPILLIGAVGMSTTLSSHTVTQKLLEIGLFAGFMKLFLLFLPWFCITLALTFLYIFIPNTKVHLLPALFAGMAAGFLWQVTQYGYIHFQVGVAKYNAIYGTFASVPVFLVWVYLSWVIVLAGAELSFACQNVRQFHGIDMGQSVNYSTREKVALCVLLELCREYEKGELRLTAEGISGKSGLPVALVNQALDHLGGIEYILPVEKDREMTFVPSRPTEKLLIADFFEDFKKSGDENNLKFASTETSRSVEEALNRHLRSLQYEFKKESFRDLLASS